MMELECNIAALTRNLQHSLLLLALTYVHLLGNGCQGCPQSQINECINLLTPYDLVEQSSVIFPHFSDSSLEKICRGYTEMEECLREERKGCNIADRSQFLGLEAATRYLCEDGKDDYRRHRDCYAQANVSEIGIACNRTYNADLLTIRLEKHSTLEEKKKKLCSYTTEKIRCIRAGVNEMCGKSAGSWLYTIEMKRLTPTLRGMGCSKKIQLGIPAIFGIMLAIFTIVMIIILTIVVCQKRRGNTSLRAIKPRSRSKPPPKKKNNNACATKMAAKPVAGCRNNGRESLDVPAQKPDANFVDGQSEVSYLAASTAPLSTTVTEVDTECTTYVVTENET